MIEIFRPICSKYKHINSLVRIKKLCTHVNSTVHTQDQEKSSKSSNISNNKNPPISNDNVCYRNRYVCSI